MVSGNLFHCRKNSWPPEEYISKTALQLVSSVLHFFFPFLLRKSKKIKQNKLWKSRSMSNCLNNLDELMNKDWKFIFSFPFPLKSNRVNFIYLSIYLFQRLNPIFICVLTFIFGLSSFFLWRTWIGCIIYLLFLIYRLNPMLTDVDNICFFSIELQAGLISGRNFN